MKTAKFADVVKTGGTPETYLLWMPAKDDPVFQRALKENRIVTLHQELRGSKKDYGQVGFHEEANAQFIIFPKSVGRFKDQHLIGIDYDLFAKNSRSGAAPVAVARVRKKVLPKPRRGLEEATADAAEILDVARSQEVEPKDREKSSAVSPPEPASAPPSGKDNPARTAASVAARTNGRRSLKATAQPEVPPRFLAEVEKAMKELRAGKSVLAYQRLETLLHAGQAVAKPDSANDA